MFSSAANIAVERAASQPPEGSTVTPTQAVAGHTPGAEAEGARASGYTAALDQGMGTAPRSVPAAGNEIDAYCYRGVGVDTLGVLPASRATLKMRL
jgi:hypothetical protein